MNEIYSKRVHLNMHNIRSPIPQVIAKTNLSRFSATSSLLPTRINTRITGKQWETAQRSAQCSLVRIFCNIRAGNAKFALRLEQITRVTGLVID